MFGGMGSHSSLVVSVSFTMIVLLVAALLIACLCYRRCTDSMRHSALRMRHSYERVNRNDEGWSGLHTPASRVAAVVRGIG